MPSCGLCFLSHSLLLLIWLMHPMVCLSQSGKHCPSRLPFFSPHTCQSTWSSISICPLYTCQTMSIWWAFEAAHHLLLWLEPIHWISQWALYVCFWLVIYVDHVNVILLFFSSYFPVLSVLISAFLPFKSLANVESLRAASQPHSLPHRLFPFYGLGLTSGQSDTGTY